MECWKRENARLCFEWDVENYEFFEPDLPEYVRRHNQIMEMSKDKSVIVKFLLENLRYLKFFISFLVILFMIGLVCMDIVAVALFRIYIKLKAFPDDNAMKIFIGDFGSIFLNTFLIMFLNLIYKKIATALTKWENHRTRTNYADSLILKLFAFEFVNSYGSLFYLAYFRNFDYPNGLFNLGVKYQDRCDNNYCMPLLSTQILVILLVKPIPRFFTTIIVPLLDEFYKKWKLQKYFCSLNKIYENNVGDHMTAETDSIINERAVFLYVCVERTKTLFSNTIAEEYTEKVLLFGYLILFACSFSLAPLLLLIINLVDLRVDAKRLLWLYRRPVGYKAQDIGSWFNICRLLNAIGIVNNGFLIAFTTNWSKDFLGDSNEKRFIFIIIFEHAVFFIWILITFILPDVPQSVQSEMRYEIQYVKEITSAAKYLKDEMKSNSNNNKPSDRINNNNNKPVIRETPRLNLRFKQKNYGIDLISSLQTTPQTPPSSFAGLNLSPFERLEISNTNEIETNDTKRRQNGFNLSLDSGRIHPQSKI